MKSDLRIFAFAVIASGIVACSPQDKNDSSASGSTAGKPTPAVSPASAIAATPAATTAPASGASNKPGGTIEQAGTAAIGAVIEGEIQKTGQTDFYRFDNPSKQRDLAIVRLQNKSATLRPYFKLYNADRSQTAENYDGTPGASVERTLALEPGQTLYVAVQDYDSIGKYMISITPQKAFDAHEPNDDALTATASTIGAANEGSIMDDKDADWFRIRGATQKTIHVTLDNLSATLRPYVKIYSSTKSQITEKYDGTPGANLDFTVDIEPGKDFYMQVAPYSSTGKYKLTAMAQAAQ